MILKWKGFLYVFCNEFKDYEFDVFEVILFVKFFFLYYIVFEEINILIK